MVIDVLIAIAIWRIFFHSKEVAEEVDYNKIRKIVKEEIKKEHNS